MAFSITQIGNDKNSAIYKEYTVDYKSDIALLPTSISLGKQTIGSPVDNDYCAIGSKATVIEGNGKWILGNDNVWHEITQSSSSAGVSQDLIDKVNELEKEHSIYENKFINIEAGMPTPIPLSEVVKLLNSSTVTLDSGTYDDPISLSASCQMLGAQMNVTANSGKRCTDEELEDETVITGTITIQDGASVVFNGLTLSDKAKITLEGNCSLALINCRILNVDDGSASLISSDFGCNAQIYISDCYFGTNTGNIYNAFNLNCKLSDTAIVDNYFAADVCTHNIINIYNVCDNAKIYIVRNTFEKSANAIRVGIIGEPVCYIRCDGNTYNSTDENEEYAGLMIIQPYEKHTTSFANCHISINNTTHSDPYPVYYLYADKNDMQFDDINKPVITIDGQREEL